MLKVQTVETDWKNDIPSGLTWYFVGQPKTGKTTAASSWSSKGRKGVLLIDTDLGADFVDGANILTCIGVNPPQRVVEKDGVKVTKNGKVQTEVIPPEERGFCYRSGPNKGEPMPVYTLKEILSDLTKNWKDYGVDTIVIDTIDQVNEWIERLVTEEMGTNVMGEGQWGSDWALARKKNLNILVQMQRFVKKVGGNLVLISHSKPTGMTDNKVQVGPSLPRGLAMGLCAKADVIGYATCNREDQTYNVSFVSYDERMVGSRLKPLSQKELPFEYDAVINEIKSYKEEK